ARSTSAPTRPERRRDVAPAYGSASLFRDTTKLTPDEARDLVRRLESRARSEDEIAARAEYLSLLDLHPGQHVLDVGCGSGVVARDVARRVQPNGRVVGVDPSPAPIAAARDLVDAALSDHTAVDSWLARELPALLETAGLADVRVRAFMPLERQGDGFYAGMAERAAAVARDTGAITEAEQAEWMKRLRQQAEAG